MKVTNTRKVASETTLNAIPNGQVFRGEVYGKYYGTWVRGLFLKVHGGWRSSCEHELLVVGLESHSADGYSNIFTYCTPVRNYEPLEVELVIK